MPPPPLAITPLQARHFLRRALGFDEPHPTVASALEHHGYIQIDPINICGRMHDLILRNRVAGYREGDLMRFLHGEASPLPPTQRAGFEHHVPGTGILVAFPLDAWPYLKAEMRARSRRPGAWAGRLTPREKILAEQLLAEIARRGPLGSEDFEDDRQARRVWGAAKLVKATLQKLFFHGRILIAQRENNRRRYDLPERVLPSELLGRGEPSMVEAERWRVLLQLRQRRLVALRRADLARVENEVQPVVVEGCPPLFCLRSDADRLRDARARPREPIPQIALLAPLDPLIYDRRLTARLWGFDYTWEAYTPAAKRVRGHYALPVLAGTEIIGHVNPRADRTARRLSVASRRLRRGFKVTPALRHFAQWLGLT